jgi:hypothetical protein
MQGFPPRGVVHSESLNDLRYRQEIFEKSVQMASVTAQSVDVFASDSAANPSR